MLRARVIDYGKMTLERVPAPVPGAGDVLVAIEVCGICGSDIHAFLGVHPFVHPPIVPGHELGGVIAALGRDVTGLQPGDRVTIEPSLVCGRCRNCRRGRYNICDSLKVIGCQSDGGMAEYLSVPADRIVRVPDDMSLDEAAFVEPAAVAVHSAACVRDLADADVVAVLGAGPIGLLVTQVARAMGVRELIVTDTVPERLRVAEALGATHVVNVRRDDITGWMTEHYGKGNPVDVCFDCVGLEPSLDAAVRIVQKGATIVAVGVYPGKVAVDMSWVQDRELMLIGSPMYMRNDFLTAIRLIQEDKIRVAPLIARKVPLQQVVDVYATFASGPGGGIKTLIDVAAARQDRDAIRPRSAADTR